MPARNSINPNQLALFYSARELRDRVINHSKDDTHGDLEDMWNNKLEEAQEPWDESKPDYLQTHGAGVYDSIKEKGYKGSRLVLAHGPSGATWVTNGHHRIAAAAQIEEETGVPVFIPIEHISPEHDGWVGAMGSSEVDAWREHQPIEKKRREAAQRLWEQANKEK